MTEVHQKFGTDQIIVPVTASNIGRTFNRGRRNPQAIPPIAIVGTSQNHISQTVMSLCLSMPAEQPIIPDSRLAASPRL